MNIKSVILLLVVSPLVAYAYLFNKQLSDVDAVCAQLSVGSPVGDLNNIENNYSLHLMGPSKDSAEAETERAIFCASMTMCDTSCAIEFKNGIVSKSTVTHY